MTTLSVGYVIDDGDQPGLVCDLIEKSRSAQHYSIDYLIVQLVAEAPSLPNKLRKLFRGRRILQLATSLYFRAIFAMEKRLFVKNPELKAVLKIRNIDNLELPKLYVRPLKSSSGFIYQYGEDDLESIRRLNIDVLLHRGSGVLRGGVLDVCQFGVVSFYHGNNEVNLSSGPPAFWEVFNHEPSTGFIIQRLLDELDGDDMLAKGSIATASPYARNLARIYKKSNIFVHKFLEDLGQTKALPRALPKSPYSYRVSTAPSIRDLARYQINMSGAVARRLFYRLTGRYHRWGVAYQFTESWQNPVLWKSKFIANPPYRFLADPFLFRHENFNVCFVEDFDFRKNKAKISAFGVSRDGHEELGTALDEPFHLSYPFIFTVSDELYMCPETAEINEIRLYRCSNFPLQWSLHATLMKGVSAADTNIFQFADRWWLFTNIDSANMGDHNSELHIFSADSFDSDLWVPHANNPVIFDSERARNGGFFRDGDKLLRVFQCQGYDLYGESMGVAEIKELGMETYREEVLSRIEPRFAPKIVGTHSFSYHNGLLAIDFQKVERIKISR